MSDDVRMLIAPLHRLEPDQALRAIHIARGLGRAFGAQFARCLACLIGRGMPIRANHRAYYTYLIESSWHEAGLDSADLRQWQEGFDNDDALRDPRVQAFCTGLSEYALELAVAVSRRRKLLATYLEVRTEQIAVHGNAPGDQVVFGYRRERYLVLTEREAPASRDRFDEGSSDTARHGVPGCLQPRAGESSPPAIEESIFLGHRILRWTATGHEPDGEWYVP